MAPAPGKSQLHEGSQEWRCSLDPRYPNDSQLQVYDIYIIRRVLLAAHARSWFIWTSRKSVDHGTNDRVMAHGDVTRADGRRSGYVPIVEIVGSQVDDQRVGNGVRINVVDNQAGYLARPTTKAPETQIYFTTHRSGANSVPSVRTVASGERASRSIVNRTTALWSIWMVASLILADSGIELVFV